jgi:ABC-type multidrug transport system fused ATPase/permease subunit
MNDYVKIGLPAVLGLVGTIITVLVTVYLARRQARRTRQQQYGDKSSTVYDELWERLEGIHIAIRTERFDEERLSDRLRELNSFILAKSIYLDDEDRALANDYIHKVKRFGDTVQLHGRDQDKQRLNETGAMNPDAIRDVLAQEEAAMSVRERIRTKIKNRISGEV